MTPQSESIRRHVFRMVFRLYRLDLISRNTWLTHRNDVAARDNFCARWTTLCTDDSSRSRGARASLDKRGEE